MAVFDKKKKIVLEGKTTSKWVEMTGGSKMNDTMELLEENKYDIPSAITIREATKKAKKEKIIREVTTINQLIKNASRHGRSKIEFNVCKEIMPEIRRLYQEAGYKTVIKINYSQDVGSITLDWEDEDSNDSGDI